MRRIVFAYILLLPLTLHASNRDVPLSDPLYQDIDLLVACNAIHSIHYGQRPWSQSEMRRLVAEAEEGLSLRTIIGDACHQVVQRALEQLHTRFDERPVPSPTLSIEGYGTSQTETATVGQNGLGHINLRAAPLTMFREGKTVRQKGGGLFLDVYQTVHAQSWFSFTLEPQGWLEIGPNNSAVTAHGTLWEALAKFSIRNLELSVGRGRVIWGPAEHGGLLLTDNAPPLDMVRLRTPHPFRLPWFFRHIGTIKTSFLFSYLGPRFTPAETILSGYRFDVQPHPWVTVGLNHLVMLGGAGVASPSATEAIAEFVGFVRPGHGNAASNHAVGIDLHVRVPPWRGTQFYAAYAYEDPDTVPEIQFDQQAAWLFGFYLPRLSSDGIWQLRGEFWRAGAGMYRHVPYTDGWTLQGHGLGHPFGGDSHAAWLTLTHAQPSHPRFQWQCGVIDRSSNQYATVTDSSGDRIAIDTVTDGLEEVSAYALSTIDIPLKHGWSARAGLGYAHSWNANFIPGKTQHNLMAEARLQWRPAKSH